MSLQFAYFNPKSPAYLGSIAQVYKYVKKLKPTTTRQEVKQFLDKQETYALHRPLKRKFLRNKTIPLGYMTGWQADLVDVHNLAKHNNRNTFILTVIDVFSRMGWAVPVKNKTPQEVAKGFGRVLRLSHPHRPFSLYTDLGKEFVGKAFTEFLDQHQIKHKTAQNQETKSAICERWNRSLKELMWKYFHQRNTLNYTKMLPTLVKHLNERYHRILKMRPVDVSQANERAIWERLYGDIRPKKDTKFAFAVGDGVRISRAKGVFTKGYVPKFTKEIFLVAKCLNRRPPVYELTDAQNEPIFGVFYKEELYKCTPPTPKR